MDGHMTTAYTVLAQLCMVKMKKCINTTGWSTKVDTFSLVTAMQPSKKIYNVLKVFENRDRVAVSGCSYAVIAVNEYAL